jgi:hypothetical protein
MVGFCRGTTVEYLGIYRSASTNSIVDRGENAPVISSLIEPIEALRTRLADLEPLASIASFLELARPAGGLCSRACSSCIAGEDGNGSVLGSTVPGNPVPPPPSSSPPFKYRSTVSTASLCAGVLCKVACPDGCSPRFRSWRLGKLGSCFGLAADETLDAGLDECSGVMFCAGRSANIVSMTSVIAGVEVGARRGNCSLLVANRSDEERGAGGEDGALRKLWLHIELNSKSRSRVSKENL